MIFELYSINIVSVIPSLYTNIGYIIRWCWHLRECVQYRPSLGCWFSGGPRTKTPRTLPRPWTPWRRCNSPPTWNRSCSRPSGKRPRATTRVQHDGQRIYTATRAKTSPDISSDDARKSLILSTVFILFVRGQQL